MKKKLILGLLIAVFLALPSFAQPKQLEWKGDYMSKETTLVALKRLSFFREKDGTLKAQGALVGFPDEVSIGEAIVEGYQTYPNNSNSEKLILSFNSSDVLTNT